MNFQNGLLTMKKVKITPEDLAELIYWARRYCDGRHSYAPSSFNSLYKRIKFDNPDFIPLDDKFDHTLTENGKFWPYAQDYDFDIVGEDIIKEIEHDYYKGFKS